MTKCILNNFVLRLNIFAMTIIPLKNKLEVSICIFILCLFPIHAPYYKYDLNNLMAHFKSEEKKVTMTYLKQVKLLK